MTSKDISFNIPQKNLDYDESLLQSADKEGAGEFLRFWESPVVFIVLGRIGKIEDDVNVPEAKADGVEVLRRSSGGGTVVQGPGCLNYSLILSKQNYPQLNDLRKSYEWIAGKVIEALRPAGVEAYFRPISDLATGTDERKFSGNAQHRGKEYILHHGTLLYNFDLSLISRYLKMPKDIPTYRQDRSHNRFVANVPLKTTVFKQKLAKIFGA